MKNPRYLIYHREKKVFLGIDVGSGVEFWSSDALTPLAFAVTFSSVEETKEFSSRLSIDSCAIVEVEADYGRHISLGSCVKLGLPSWLNPSTICYGEG